MIAISLEIPIYCGKLHIAFSEDVIADKEALNKRFPDVIEDRADFCAITEGRKNHFLAVFNMKNIKIIKDEADLVETISHEAFHLTNFIFKRKGIQPDVNNDEPQAYLLGWMSGQIYKVYLKYKAQQDVKKV